MKLIERPTAGGDAAAAQKPQNLTPARRTASLGLMCAAAVALNFLETLIPPLPFYPPGGKIGLSNVAVMVTAMHYSVPDALLVALVKSAFVGITRGATAFMMSVLGGLLSALAVSLIIRCKPDLFGYAGLGITGALCHNTGQLLGAWALMGSRAVIGYAPWMLLFALVSGAVTGFIVKLLLPALGRLEASI
ncbi:MAG: Gx transporter family protein [Clostridiales bacterium]|nr:Gx transporter family protein [Clostridiales bacterium]